MSASAADTTETMPRGVRMDRYRALGAGAGVKGFTPSGLCLHSWGVYIYIILCVYIYKMYRGLNNNWDRVLGPSIL